MNHYDKLIFEISDLGKKAYRLPICDVNEKIILPKNLQRESELCLPQVTEPEVVRHFTQLSMKNYGLDGGFYPLGSCTMKYNPKINEDVATMTGFKDLHPYQPESTVQGALQLMYELDGMLSEITGMEKFSLQPAAGAHGELTGLMIFKAYHENRGDLKRKKIIVPDSSHDTNPASAAEAGFEIIEIKSAGDGTVDLEALKVVLNEEVAGLMLTNPNTLGLFESNMKEIAYLVHQAGGLLYYDGANMNAIMGITRPGDMGFDVIHLNLHKTFSTPHGGGGPGAGPIGVSNRLTTFLPQPTVEIKGDGTYFLKTDNSMSIGKVRSFYGSFSILVRAYCYIKSMGAEGLKEATQVAVLNANYLKEKLKGHYELPFDRICMHEFVLSGLKDKASDIATLDVAKRLIDLGYHPPTIYFPLIVDHALMIEPTETESIETLDSFAKAMIQIAEEATSKPELLKESPTTAPVRRLDEVSAARKPKLKW